MTDEADDEQLIEQVCLGESERLRILCERYTPQLIPHAINYCQSENYQFGEDVAQLTWIQVFWKSCEFYNKGNGSFRRWLFTINRNKAIDECRKKNRRRETPGIDDLLPAVSPNSDSDALSALKECRELLKDDKDVQIALLKYQGKTPGEIAEEKHIPLSEVYRRTHAGLQKLKDCISRKMK